MTGANSRCARLRPDFNLLETFLKVAESRSFAEAARQLGVTKPAVSQTIAKLEALYGGDLCERRRESPVALTPIGAGIFASAKLPLFMVDEQIDRPLATAQSSADMLRARFHPVLIYGPLSEALIAGVCGCPAGPSVKHAVSAAKSMRGRATGPPPRFWSSG